MIEKSYWIYKKWWLPINPIQTGGGGILPALTLDVYNLFNKQA